MAAKWHSFPWFVCARDVYEPQTERVGRKQKPLNKAKLISICLERTKTSRQQPRRGWEMKKLIKALNISIKPPRSSAVFDLCALNFNFKWNRIKGKKWGKERRRIPARVLSCSLVEASHDMLALLIAFSLLFVGLPHATSALIPFFRRR